MTRILAVTEYYNEANNIPQLVENLATQSHVPDLWLIIDDGSTDNSTELFEECLKQHQIQYLLYQMPPKSKPNANLKGRAFQKVDILNNEWVDSNEFDYLILIGADTRFPVNYIELGTKILNRIPEVGVIAGRIYGEPRIRPMGSGKLVRWEIVRKTSGRYWDLDPDSLWNIITLNMGLKLLIIEDMLIEVTRPTLIFGPRGFYNYGARMFYVGWSFYLALFYTLVFFIRKTHPSHFLRGYLHEFTKKKWYCDDSEVRKFYGIKRIVLGIIGVVPRRDRGIIVKLGINMKNRLDLDEEFLNQIVQKIKEKLNRS
jgi:glycosyltransferase involved in cell wall biosynthesis